ncbi:MAG: polysaccharide biosynthesis tyrosine autokinase [Clostridia bacterium]
MTTAQKLVETCRIISKSNTALDRVSQTLKDQYNIDISANKLANITNVSAVTNTQFLRISVVTNDPEKSMRICNAMAESASEEFSRIVKKASIQTVYFGEVEELPVSPNIPLNIVVAAIVGLILSFVIAFIFDMMNVTVKSEDDLSARYGLPVFAEIPDREQKIHNKGYYAYNKSNAKRSGSESIEISIVESYNTARTNLQFALGPHDRKIIVFTSSGPSEGKSTVSSNIVASFAKASNRVLFIDADLRRPAVHNIFKLENKNGLSLMLCGLSKFADVVHKDVIPNLDVITSGPIPPNPSELLISPFMKKIIDAHIGEYDYIFIDTPPVHACSDTLLFNSISAGIVFLVREGRTDHPEILDALEQIKTMNGNVLGMIKSFCRFKKRGHYGNKYKYGKYYKYAYTSHSSSTTTTTSSSSSALSSSLKNNEDSSDHK